MSELTISSVDALGHATPREAVTVTLTDADGVPVEQAYLTDGGQAVIRTASFALNDQGLGSIDLTPNAEITPANTIYTVTLGDTVWRITKGTGSENLVNIAAAPAELGGVLGLGGLADVDLAGLVDGETVVWDDDAGRWVPGTVAASASDWAVELAAWNRAVAAGDALAVVIGDSFSEPIIVPELWTSWVPKLERRLAARQGTRGQPALHSGWEGVHPSVPTWTHDGTEGDIGLGGMGVALTGAQTATRVDRECDAIELWFAQGGVALVSVDGGAADSVDASSGVTSWSSGALTWGEHDVVVSVSSGTVRLVGGYFHAGTLDGIRFHNSGHGGSSLADHLAGGDYSGTIDHIAAVQPDLVVIANGLIDHSESENYPTVLEQAVQEVQAAAPSASVLIVVEYQPINGDFAGWADVAPAAALEVARDYGCAVLDHTRGIGAPPPAGLFAGGSIFPPANGTTSDGVHLNEQGMDLAADLAARLLVPAGQPVIPAPRAGTEAALVALSQAIPTTASQVGAIPTTGGETSGEIRRVVTTAGFLTGTLAALRGDADTHDRLAMGSAFGTATVSWGPGNAALDTGMVRASAGLLRPVDGAGSLARIETATPTTANHAANKAYVDGPPTSAVAASRNLAIGDLGTTILVSATATLTLASLGTWPVGGFCRIVQTGTDAVTVAAGGGQTLRAPAGAASTAQGSIGVLMKIASAVWTIQW